MRQRRLDEGVAKEGRVEEEELESPWELSHRGVGVSWWRQ